MSTKEFFTNKVTMKKTLLASVLFLPLAVTPFFAHAYLNASRVDKGNAPSAEKKAAFTPIVAEYEIKESRTLADGNVLEKKTSGMYYRDSYGRMRREQGSLIAVTDPIAGVSFVLDTEKKIARKLVLPTNPEAITRSLPNISRDNAPATERASLGEQVIEGIKVKGKEYVSVIPAMSKLGNRQPIEVTFQIWTSEEDRLPLLTKAKDPVNGERTQRYKRIRKGVEPDPKLFQIPEGYQVIEVNPAQR